MRSNIFFCFNSYMLTGLISLLSTKAQAQEQSRKLSAPPLFIENFEKRNLNKGIWEQAITGNNSIQIQRDKVAHGKRALRVSCTAASNRTWAFITTSKVPASLQQHHFGRAYIYITPQPPLRHTIFIMAGTPGFPKNKFQEVATANARWQLTYVDLSPTADKEDYHSAGSIPNGRWFCLEWEFNDHPNHTAIWVDGEPVFETDFISKNTSSKTDLIGGFANYAFGFRLWGDAFAPFDIYFDDIALDSKRIGLIKMKKEHP